MASPSDSSATRNCRPASEMPKARPRLLEGSTHKRSGAMADTVRSKDEVREYFDTPDVLDAKVEQLCAWIRDAAHFIAFTGAGERLFRAVCRVFTAVSVGCRGGVQACRRVQGFPTSAVAWARCCPRGRACGSCGRTKQTDRARRRQRRRCRRSRPCRTWPSCSLSAVVRAYARAYVQASRVAARCWQ